MYIYIYTYIYHVCIYHVCIFTQRTHTNLNVCTVLHGAHTPRPTGDSGELLNSSTASAPNDTALPLLAFLPAPARAITPN